MARTSPLVQALTARLANFPSLDPRAVLAVASQEGLGGGIGDQGTSFGPFQLHYGGAYPSWAPRGQQASQAWATAPEGLDYALRNIQSVAGGLRGPRAINNIVSRFERPANPQREIARALSAYGAPAPAYTPQAAPTQPRAAAPAASTPAQQGLPQAVLAALRILSA